MTTMPKTPPPGFSDEVWRDLRHDLRQSARSMENMANLASKGIMTPDEIAMELRKIAKQVAKVHEVLFEE